MAPQQRITLYGYNEHYIKLLLPSSWPPNPQTCTTNTQNRECENICSYVNNLYVFLMISNATVSLSQCITRSGDLFILILWRNRFLKNICLAKKQVKTDFPGFQSSLLGSSQDRHDSHNFIRQTLLSYTLQGLKMPQKVYPHL